MKQLLGASAIALTLFAAAAPVRVSAATAASAAAWPQEPAQTQAPAGQTLSPERQEQLQERLKQLGERLALTPEQKEQVRPVLVDELQQMKALREKSQSENRSRREKRRTLKDAREIQSDTDKKLAAILSEPQMKELKKIREEWRQQMRERAKER